MERDGNDPVRLAQLAYALLYEETNTRYIFSVSYSRKFKAYNANVRKKGSEISFSLSAAWKDVSVEIVIGLMQHLLLRLRKDTKRSTVNIDLYNAFIKNLDKAQTRREYDPVLSASFDRINAKYLTTMLDRPSLIWEGSAQRTLATYNFHDDTIRVSSVFKDAPEEIIDFLIYHESLHKLLKYQNMGQRIMHHTKQFRRLESMYEDYDAIDGKIKAFLTQKRRGHLAKYLRFKQ